MSGGNLLEALSDNIVVDPEKCVACGICVDKCPLDNLRLKLSPCRQACPLGVNARGYVQLLARGEEEEALAAVRESVPFPGILGRVCSQPCESRCHHAASGSKGVAVRALKRYLADSCGAAPAPLPEMKPATGRRVAVIGAGPAGLLASYDLKGCGHDVVIFDAGPRPGGMLRQAVPEFRLPSEVLDREIGLLERMGVSFSCGTRVDEEGMSGIVEAFDAVVVASGCTASRPLEIEGADLEGVHYALPFLAGIRAGSPPHVGSRVVVVGGGNAAVDAAQSALRLGAREVSLLCLEGLAEMPVFPWVLEGALGEGVSVKDSLGPVRFNGRGGRLTGITAASCLRVFDEAGRFRPCLDPCRSVTVKADTVVIAVGQCSETDAFERLGITRKGRLAFDPVTLETPREKIFCAGDAASGPSSVVEAMASGRRAAESVRRFLAGEPMRYGRSRTGPVETDYEIVAGKELSSDRVALPERRFEGPGDFGEVETCLDGGSARREAQRCVSCGGPFGRYRTCWFCLPCEIECPHEALRVEIPYLLE